MDCACNRYFCSSACRIYDHFDDSCDQCKEGPLQRCEVSSVSLIFLLVRTRYACTETPSFFFRVQCVSMGSKSISWESHWTGVESDSGHRSLRHGHTWGMLRAFHFIFQPLSPHRIFLRSSQRVGPLPAKSRGSALPWPQTDILSCLDFQVATATDVCFRDFSSSSHACLSDVVSKRPRFIIPGVSWNQRFFWFYFEKSGRSRFHPMPMCWNIDLRTLICGFWFSDPSHQHFNTSNSIPVTDNLTCLIFTNTCE